MRFWKICNHSLRTGASPPLSSLLPPMTKRHALDQSFCVFITTPLWLLVKRLCRDTVQARALIKMRVISEDPFLWKTFFTIAHHQVDFRLPYLISSIAACISSFFSFFVWMQLLNDTSRLEPAFESFFFSSITACYSPTIYVYWSPYGKTE